MFPGFYFAPSYVQVLGFFFFPFWFLGVVVVVVIFDFCYSCLQTYKIKTSYFLTDVNYIYKIPGSQL